MKRGASIQDMDLHFGHCIAYSILHLIFAWRQGYQSHATVRGKRIIDLIKAFLTDMFKC